MTSRKEIDLNHKIVMDASPPSLHAWDPIQGRGLSFRPSPACACCHVQQSSVGGGRERRRRSETAMTRRPAGGALGRLCLLSASRAAGVPLGRLLPRRRRRWGAYRALGHHERREERLDKMRRGKGWETLDKNEGILAFSCDPSPLD